VTHTPVAAGTSCPNGNECDGLEACNGSGACVSGTPPNLDDGNVCTTDSCDPVAGIQHVAVSNGTPCLDGTVCNGDESCNQGACAAGTPPVVDDGNQCTTDNCDPDEGVVHTPIPGCDQMPSNVGDRLETRASITGRVEDETGAPVTDFTVEVFDAPPLEPHDEDPRSDASTTTAADGSFRTRLEAFPQAASPGTPLHRVLVFVEGPSFIRMSREAYLRPGDIADLGSLVVLRRDSNVTIIDSSGGIATDSQNLIELNFPPGAVIGNVPVRITPIINREQFPTPLPDTTATMYGVVFEPHGTEFMVPVTMRVANYRDVSTDLQIPFAFVDEETGLWKHEDFAGWDGERFRASIRHFSTLDVNGPRIGELVLHQRQWADPNKKGEVKCGVGSDVSLASGSLRQSIALPTYARQGGEYGITLSYDSGLTSSRRTEAPATTPAQALRPSSFSVLVSGSSFRTECAFGGLTIGGGCGTGAACFSGGVNGGGFQLLQQGLGTRSRKQGTTTGDTQAFGSVGYVDLPLNEDGTAPAPSYARFEQFLAMSVPVNDARRACLGGGVAFGVAGTNQEPQLIPLTVPPGPDFRSSEYRLVYHRRGAAVGNGWGIAEVNELFVTPDRAQADLVTGDGHHEVFGLRPRATLVAPGGRVFPDSHDPLGAAGTGIARDFQTGEIFVIDNQFNALGQIELFRLTAAGGIESYRQNIPIPPNLGPNFGVDLRLAVAHTSAGRVFAIANGTGLYAVADAGAVTQLAEWSVFSNDEFTRPSVAARGSTIYATSGIDDLVQRIDLDAASPVLEPVTSANGDIALDPEALAGDAQLQGAQGLAVKADGSLLVACPDRNAIYHLQADASGSVGPESEVRRVVGDGSSTTIPRVGTKHPALAMGVRGPFEVTVGPDDSVFVLSPVGIVAYDSQENVVSWVLDSISTQGREFPLFSAARAGQIQALGTTSFLVKFLGGLYRIDHDFLASDDDPTRTLTLSDGGAVLTDANADLVENYAFFDSFKGKARLVSRSGRSGEALLAVSYDSSNRLSRVSDPTGGGYQFSYDGSGKVQSISDAAGRSTGLNVDSDGNLRSVAVAGGGTWDFTYELTRMTSATNPRGGQSVYTYRADGSLESSTKPEGAKTTVVAPLANGTYDETGRLVYVATLTDARDVTQTVTTNAHGNIMRVQSAPDGVSHDFRVGFAALLRGAEQSVDRANSVFRVEDAQLNGIQIAKTRHFDDVGRLMNVFGTSTSFRQFGFEYGEDDRLSTLTHRAGSELNLEYDASGRLSRAYDTAAVVGPTGREVLFTWRSDGQPSTVTQHGVTSTLGYDGSTGQLTSVSDITGNQAFSYDAAGNVTSVADGVTTAAYSYDSGNRLTEIRDALGNTTTIAYDEAGCSCTRGDLPTRVRTPDLPLDRQWSFAYDLEGHVTEVRNPLEQLETFTYAPTGELETATDRLGRTTSVTHDQQGRPTMLVDSAGRVSVMTYPIPVAGVWQGPTLVAASPNATPAPTSLTAPLGPGQYQIGYNAYGNVDKPPAIELYRDATFELSFHRRIDSVMTDEIVGVFDRVGLPIDSTQQPPENDRLFTREIFQYDNRFASPFLGASFATIDNFQATNSVTRNVHAEVTSAQSSSPNFVEAFNNFNRDAAGRATSWSNAGSRLSRDSSVGVAVQYDPATGYVTRHTAGIARRDISYDERGLVREASLSFPGNYGDGVTSAPTIDEGTFQYEYDQIGRNTRLEFPDGHVRIQVWDALGRLTSRCYNYTPPNPSRCYTATYDPIGNPEVLTDPEGRTEIDYDALDRVTEVRRFESGVLIETETYAYNALGGFSVYDGEIVDDQRARLTGGGTAPAAIPASVSSVTVELDGGGRVARIGATAFFYDNRGRVSGFTSGGNFFYDAFGRRTMRYHGVTPEYLGWDGDNPAGMRDTEHVTPPLGSPPEPPAPQPHKWAFVYDGIDHPLWMLDRDLLFPGVQPTYQGASIYFELDTLGNVRRLRGGLKVIDRSPVTSDLGGYRYSAFGKQRPPTASTPLPIVGIYPISQPFRWQGRWALNDAATIYDFRSRFWSTELGAFLQPDAFQYLGRTGTLWSWPGQNPFRWRDPYGMFAVPGPDPVSASIFAFLAGWQIGVTATDITFGLINAFDRAARENDIAAFDAASRDRQERRRRERQAGAGEQSCPPSPEAGGAGDKPPGGPPRNITTADDEAPLPGGPIRFGQADVSNTFAHGPFAGKTIGQVAAGLRAGAINPNQLPIEIVVRNGQAVALNNRSLLALQRAGLSPTRVINRTGDLLAERSLDRHLRGGAPSGSIRIRGLGPGASLLE
jgi:RHS repeat-associated protein